MKKYFLVLALVLTTSSLFAKAEDYAQGLRLYSNKAYEQAFPIIYSEALEENRAAQYRLGVMYENGYGTPVNFKQAMYWYKLSSTQYDYVESDPHMDVNASYVKQLSNQIGNDSLSRGNEFALAKMDTSTSETKALVESLTNNGFFGLQPYHTNYFLPVSYGNDKPPRYTAAIPSSSTLLDGQTYDKHNEAEFQFSLKKQLSYDLFGFNEYINFAYTQKVWWQIYADSAPFRETNYLPELFVSVPTSQKLDDKIGLEAVKLGFVHESNGQEGYRSRSWNRLYLTGLWQWENLFVATRAWYRIPESEKPDGYGSQAYFRAGGDANADGDDNPDIEKYLGYGDIRIDYLHKRNQFSLLIRNNLRLNSDNKGAVEFAWSYPFFDSPNTFWYSKIFHGYGESLIDYNREVTKVAFGFSFSRGLF